MNLCAGFLVNVVHLEGDGRCTGREVRPGERQTDNQACIIQKDPLNTKWRSVPLGDSRQTVLNAPPAPIEGVRNLQPLVGGLLPVVATPCTSGLPMHSQIVPLAPRALRVQTQEDRHVETDAKRR